MLVRSREEVWRAVAVINGRLSYGEEDNYHIASGLTLGIAMTMAAVEKHGTGDLIIPGPDIIDAAFGEGKGGIYLAAVNGTIDPV